MRDSAADAERREAGRIVRQLFQQPPFAARHTEAIGDLINK